MNIIKKYRNHRKLSVLAGILLAMFIVTTQASVYYINDNASVTYQTEDDRDGTTSTQYITKDVIAVTSIQLNLDKPFQVVFELLQPDDEPVVAKPETVPLCLEFFRNLFRLTISPNAP